MQEQYVFLWKVDASQWGRIHFCVYAWHEHCHVTAPLLTYMLRMLPEAWFDSKQSVFLLEAECVSTRSSACFYSKQRVLLLEARQPAGRPFVASRCSRGRRVVVWLPPEPTNDMP